jgi:hypothetical protein
LIPVVPLKVAMDSIASSVDVFEEEGHRGPDGSA